MTSLFTLLYLFILSLSQLVSAQSAGSTAATVGKVHAATGTGTGTGTITSGPTTGTASPTRSTSGSGASSGLPGVSTGPPDVKLVVPTLHVGKIELDVEELSANINLNAKIASLVTLNAGVALSVQKVNITISDIDAELELTVRLGHLVDIVNRVFQSLDLNPLLISTLNNVTSLVDDVVGEVDGLLGSITQGGTKLNFIIDNLGNIVQQVGDASTIVGNYLQNMTATGVEQTLSGGLTKKQFSYSPLGSLVDIVFNTAGQVVKATVEKATGSGSGTASSGTSSTAAATARR